MSFVLLGVRSERRLTHTYSRGLGELICLKFAQEGCSVAINYNASADRAKGLAAKIEKEHGMKAVVIQGVGSSTDLAIYLILRCFS